MGLKPWICRFFFFCLPVPGSACLSEARVSIKTLKQNLKLLFTLVHSFRGWKKRRFWKNKRIIVSPANNTNRFSLGIFSFDNTNRTIPSASYTVLHSRTDVVAVVKQAVVEVSTRHLVRVVKHKLCASTPLRRVRGYTGHGGWFSRRCITEPRALLDTAAHCWYYYTTLSSLLFYIVTFDVWFEDRVERQSHVNASAASAS